MKKVTLIALMALISIGCQAQQTLDVYKNVPLPPMDGITLITVNKAKFNIYAKPNGKRRAQPWGAPGELITNDGPSLFGAKMHPSGWAYIFEGSESGFASPKDFHKSKLTPFEPWMFNTAEAAFNDGHNIITWRIGINKPTGLALKIWGQEKSKQLFGIGRIKDNSLVVILHSVYINPKYQEAQSTIKVNQKKDESDNVYFEVIYGKNNAVNTNRGIRLNLETIPEEVLAKIFLPAREYLGEYREIVKDWKSIEYNQWDGIDYYNDAVNAELMSAPYVKITKQRTHMEFLGIEMGGDPAQFIQALRQKGFKDGSGFSQNNKQVFLNGMVYGMQSDVCVYTENNRVNSVSIINMVNSKTAAINRCNRFKKEMATTYGTGAKWKTLYEGAAELKLPYGTAKYQYGMFDSGVYELSMYIIDEGKSAPASQQTDSEDMLTLIEKQITTTKQKIKEAPTAENYYQLADSYLLKYQKVTSDTEKTQLLNDADNIYSIIISKFSNKSEKAFYRRGLIAQIKDKDKKLWAAKPYCEKYITMVEPKANNKTLSEEDMWDYKGACMYMIDYYTQNFEAKTLKNYLLKMAAIDPDNENVKKMLDIVKDF